MSQQIIMEAYCIYLEKNKKLFFQINKIFVDFLNALFFLRIPNSCFLELTRSFEIKVFLFVSTKESLNLGTYNKFSLFK